jgi:hypothetical protein
MHGEDGIKSVIRVCDVACSAAFEGNRPQIKFIFFQKLYFF